MPSNLFRPDVHATSTDPSLKNFHTDCCFSQFCNLKFIEVDNNIHVLKAFGKADFKEVENQGHVLKAFGKAVFLVFQICQFVKAFC